MEILVAAKVVPDLETAGFDRVRRTAVRSGVELFLNPFDQRALRIALDLRAPGDRVRVVSMGPPAAVEPLREALALGADAVALVSDPALAGSDTLVTARVLARLVARAPSALLLLGARTTDGETGQVPPEVAELLGLPLVGPARRIARAADGGWVVDRDTEEGWESVALRTPAIVSVGEKVAKLLKPTEAERAAARDRTVEVLPLAALGLEGAEAGESGSPTRVTAIRPDDPTRSGRILREGSPTERLAAALVALGPLLPEAGAAPLPPVAPRPSGGPSFAALVTDRAGALDVRSFAALSEAARLAAGGAVTAIVIGRPPDPGSLHRIAGAGATEVLVAPAGTGPIGGRRAAELFGRGLDAAGPCDAALLLSTPYGREVAARVAARRGLGLTGDAIGLRVDPAGSVVWSKPAFGERAVAEIVASSSPSLGTVRPGFLRPGARAAAPRIHPRPIDSGAELLPDDPPVLASGREPLDGYGDLDTARVAVSVGMGIGGPEGIAEVRSAIDGAGWALGATRRVVDAGWVPRALQVGLTGRSAAPDLVVLLGVRGSANHLIGWRRARRWLAINTDPEAPVLARADVGIVGDWRGFLPALVDALGADGRG